jgi:hypothetical protein
VPGTSYRSPNTATGIRPTSISHAQSEMGAKEPSTTQSLRTGSATGSTIRSWLDGHTREISRESEKLARRPPRANASRTPSQRHWPGSHPGARAERGSEEIPGLREREQTPGSRGTQARRYRSALEAVVFTEAGEATAPDERRAIRSRWREVPQRRQCRCLRATGSFPGRRQQQGAAGRPTGWRPRGVTMRQLWRIEPATPTDVPTSRVCIAGRVVPHRRGPRRSLPTDAATSSECST